MDAVTVPQEGSPPVPTHVYRCTYGSDYPSGCPCRRHNHAAPAPPAPRMAMEVAEVCVTSCPTDAMQSAAGTCRRHRECRSTRRRKVAPSRSPRSGRLRGATSPRTGSWTRRPAIGTWTATSRSMLLRARAIGARKACPSDSAGHPWPPDSAGQARGHTDEDSVLGNYLTALSPRWTTVAAIRHAGEPDYQLLEDINSLRKKVCNQLQYGLNGGRNPGTLESPPPTVAEGPHAASPATFAASPATPAVPPAMLAWLGLGVI